MSTTLGKPTAAELNQAKQLYNDLNDYLEYLAEIIESEVQDAEDDELSPTALQFLKDYKEYVSSPSQVHTQLLASDNSLSSSSRTHTKRFWKYSQTNQMLQSIPPKLLADYPKLCETKLDHSVQVSPLFSTLSTSISSTDSTDNEKLLTNDASPTVTLLKAQLEKFAREQEKNCIVIRPPQYYAPVEE